MPIRLFATLILSTLLLFPLASDSIAQEQSDQKQFEAPPNTQELSVPMTPPNEALKMMRLPAGFKATLFAAEPDIHQPIAVTTDSKGRLWVAECYTYSDRKENYDTNLNDRIVIFEDTDNDGVFDNKKVFWDKFKKLTSVEVGFGGVWVTAAPNLMFIPDANGDDIPDGEPEILLNGFEGDVIRHNIVNGLRWGPDGWLYGRHGIQGTSFVGAPDATESQRIALNCSIWRFHPQHRKFEVVAQGGTNPWGFDFDEHGEMFMINTVIGHLFHVVPNARYRRMYGSHFNPHIYQVIEQTADHFHWDTGEEHWAVTKNEGMSDGTDKAGGGHAHTGLMIYQGNNWPEEFHNKLFTANFHGRRVNSDSIHREGNSYIAHHGKDYFKTDDPWFRGIELIYGPDGGVFMLDWSDIGECHENDGIHRTSGRIFKLTHGEATLGPIENLKTFDIQKWIELLNHPNEWFARKARKRLQETAAKMAELELTGDEKSQLIADDFLRKDLPEKFKTAYEAATSVKSKLRIIWARYSCESCCDMNSEDWLLECLNDKDEHIRAWAVRLLADGLTDPSEQTATKLLEMANDDPSGLVRLYLASSIPRFDSKVALNIAARLSRREEDAKDRVQPKLIWCGLEPLVKPNAATASTMAMMSKMPLIRRNIARRLTSEIDSDPTIGILVFGMLPKAGRSIQVDFLTGASQALNGWSSVKTPNSWQQVSYELAAKNDPEINRLLTEINLVFGDGRTLDALKEIVNDNSRDVVARRNAIASLSKSNEAANLFEFLKPHLTNKSLSNEVAKAFVKCKEPAVANLLLRQHRKMDPEGQASVINVLVARKPWAKELLTNVQQEKISKTAITASHARQIQNFEDEELNGLLASTWGEVRQTSADRLEEIDRLRAKLSPDAISDASLELGQMTFEKSCASCHTMFGSGGKIGPDLTGSDRKNLNYILENVVDPSASVAESYQTSVITLDDGRFVSGVVVAENDRTIQVQTKDDLLTIDRNTIEQRKKTKNSLMPDGLLDNLSDEEIAGLVKYLSK